MEKIARLRFEGGLRFTATTASGHEVIVDGVLGNAGPRPTELVLVALGACGAMDVATILAKKRQRVSRHEVIVRAEQQEERPRIFTRIVVEHEVEGPTLDPEAVRRSIELSATKYCPVNAMLGAGVVTIRHEYVVRTDAGETRGTVVVVGPRGARLEGLTA